MKQKKSLTDWKHMKAEQISTRILYVLVGVTTVLFVLFYLVGYDVPPYPMLCATPVCR